jgi:hypothetical protein
LKGFDVASVVARDLSDVGLFSGNLKNGISSYESFSLGMVASSGLSLVRLDVKFKRSYRYMAPLGGKDWQNAL